MQPVSCLLFDCLILRTNVRQHLLVTELQQQFGKTSLNRCVNLSFIEFREVMPKSVPGDSIKGWRINTIRCMRVRLQFRRYRCLNCQAFGEGKSLCVQSALATE